MTATKMNAQEIIQFIANAEKKTSVKVTFEGQLDGQFELPLLEVLGSQLPVPLGPHRQDQPGPSLQNLPRHSHRPMSSHFYA